MSYIIYVTLNEPKMFNFKAIAALAVTLVCALLVIAVIGVTIVIAYGEFRNHKYGEFAISLTWLLWAFTVIAVKSHQYFTS
jgi:hypothetical protein